jgi:cytochrome c peroxidase
MIDRSTATPSCPDAARRGMSLFFSETHECHHCHGGFNLSDSIRFEGYAFNDTPFHNTGLYSLDGQARTRPTTPACTSTPVGPRTWVASRRRRCATSH